jgi:branched-chain amino acid transport system ATP-binding protein
LTPRLRKYIWELDRMQEVLEAHDINSYYGESHVLHDVSFKVNWGTVIAILGRNGMGKTTIIHSIIGFVPPRSGSIYFKNKNIRGLPPYLIARMGIALVPQGRRTFGSLTVKENLVFALKNKGIGQFSLDQVYSLFPRLRERENQKASLLSGGEQQMLVIGRALLTNPSLLLMDEPCEGLSPLLVQEIVSVIKHLKTSKVSVLLVEQNIPLSLTVADYVYIISKGEIVYEAKPEQFGEDVEVQNKYIGISIKHGRKE